MTDKKNYTEFMIERARNASKDCTLLGIASLGAGAGVLASNCGRVIDEINGYATLAYDKLAGITPSPEIFDGRYDGLALVGVIACGVVGAVSLAYANTERKEAKRLEDEVKLWDEWGK